MGRGRQKAKQTKVARELKYHSSSIDVNALQRELAGNSGESLGQSLPPPDDAKTRTRSRRTTAIRARTTTSPPAGTPHLPVVADLPRSPPGTSIQSCIPGLCRLVQAVDYHQPLRLAQISSVMDMIAMTTGRWPAGRMRLLVDDDVHAEDRRQRRDGQRDRGDHRQPLRGDGHLGVRPRLVELDRALQVVLLAVGHRAQAGANWSTVSSISALPRFGPNAWILAIRA